MPSHRPRRHPAGALLAIALLASLVGIQSQDCVTGTAEAASTWSSAPSMPVALGEVADGLIGGELYVVGNDSTATLAYDTAAETWTTNLASRPHPGDHHAAEVVNGKLYLFGGLGGGSEGKVQIYDPAADEWTEGAPMPFAAGSSSSAVIGNQVYVAGGIVGSSTTTQGARYNPATDTWQAIAPMPQGRNHAAAESDGAKMYVFGGRGPGSGDTNELADGFDTVQIYDPATDSWESSLDPGSTLAPLPQARGGMGTAVFANGEFWVMGGETHDGAGATADGVYDRVDAYNPTTNTWRSGPPMPTARHGIFPVLDGTEIHVVGGGVKAGYSSTTVHEVFDLASGASTPIAVASNPIAAGPDPIAVASNRFRLGRATVNERRGSARLPVTVPGPGTLTLSGRGVVVKRVRAPAAGTVYLPVTAKGQEKRILASGKVKLVVEVTYAPTGGNTNSKSKALVLRMDFEARPKRTTGLEPATSSLGSSRSTS
jgi:N-acetylneuraminic acid mutarotase